MLAYAYVYLFFYQTRAMKFVFVFFFLFFACVFIATCSMITGHMIGIHSVRTKLIWGRVRVNQLANISRIRTTTHTITYPNENICGAFRIWIISNLTVVWATRAMFNAFPAYPVSEFLSDSIAFVFTCFGGVSIRYATFSTEKFHELFYEMRWNLNLSR